MAQWVKVPTIQAWQPKFDLQNSHKGGQRELTKQSCTQMQTMA